MTDRSKKPVDVVFASCYIGECRFYRRSGRYLEQNGLSVSQVSLSRQAMLECPEDTIWFKDGAFLPRGWTNRGLPADVLRSVKSRYDPGVIDNLGAADPANQWMTPEAMRRRALEYVIRWEKIFELCPCRYYFPAAGSELFRRAGAVVARGQGAHILYQYWSRLPNRLNLGPTEMDLFEDMPVPTKLSEGREEEMEAYLKAYRKEQKPFIAQTASGYTLKAAAVKSFIRKLAQTYRYENGRHDYYTPGRLLKGAAYRMMSYPLNYPSCILRRPRSAEVEDVVSENKFVFFPFQVIWDMALTVRTSHCPDQFEVVRRCAAALPEGYHLYIKEHPHCVGQFPVRALRRLARTPNVKLIPPEVSSHDLIRAASLVIVITSTVGFESLMLGTPVIMLARTFFSRPGLGLLVEDWNELEDRVREMIGREVDQNALRTLVAAMFDHTYPGVTYSNDNSEENAVRGGKAIVEKIRRLEGGAAALR